MGIENDKFVGNKWIIIDVWFNPFIIVNGSDKLWRSRTYRKYGSLYPPHC